MTVAGDGWLAVAGEDGVLHGEVVFVEPGREVVFGRGTGSTFPLTRAAAYRRLAEVPQQVRSACQGVSRRHVRISVPAAGEALVEDLSTAGTYLDGLRLAAPARVRDLRARAHEVRFGRSERLTLRWVGG